MSPMSTPPRGGGRGGGASSSNDLANARLELELESPPTIKKPLINHNDSFNDSFNHHGSKLPPPRFPTELIHSHRQRGVSDGNFSARKPAPEATTPSYRPVPSEAAASPYRPFAAGHHHHHHHHYSGGPRQHQSPGRTIYNVASQSTGSPPSPYYQPYPWRPASTPTSASAASASASASHHNHRHTSHDHHHHDHHHHANNSHTTPLRNMVPSHEQTIETSPEFNPPRSHLRGQSRNHANATTITVRAPSKDSGDHHSDHHSDHHGDHHSDHHGHHGKSEEAKRQQQSGNNNTKQLDPITPSPHHIRQAVSDESHSPVVVMAPTVHHPPATRVVNTPTNSGGGGWSDSLHMAPLPPYVAHQMGNSGQQNYRGGGHHHHQQQEQQHQQQQHPQAWPPAMPSGSPGYPPHHGGGGHNPYNYSPYYHQQHGHHQQQQHHGAAAVPDRAISDRATTSSITKGASHDSADATSSNEAATWRKYHHLIHQFLLQFGHCNVPQGYGVGTHYEGLHAWCNEQRTMYQRMHLKSTGNHDGMGDKNPNDEARNDANETSYCTMTPTRVRILTSMGFDWGHHPNDFRSSASSSATAAAAISSTTSTAAASPVKPYSTWDRWMELLSKYRAQHGNVDVPLKFEQNPSLGTFVNRQRTEYRKMQSGKSSSMTPQRVEDLNRLGFTWAVRESHTSWEDRFAELKEFRNVNGHCNVPKIYSKNPSLGYWVNEQRFQYRRLLKKKPSYMTPEKIKMLNGLEFKWSLRETNGSWENWLKELREYKTQHGDIDVPLKYRHNQALGAFVNRQRTEHRKLQQGLQTSLTQERINNLNALGFKWAIRVSRTPWETRLEELKKFKEQHGHCNVPSTYPKNQPLAYWVFKQRGQYRIYKKRDIVMIGEKKQMCHMTLERIAKLDVIGFEWNPPRRIK